MFLDFKKDELLFAKDTYFELYDDSDIEGDSKSSIGNTKNKVCFTYTLGKIKPYPFAGIKIKKKSLLNFKSKDYINIGIKVKEKKILTVSYAVNYMAHKKRTFTTTLECLPNKNNYELKINNFSTPGWWYKDNNVTESSLAPPDFSKIVFVCIQNDILKEKGVEDEICLTSVSVSKDNSIPIYLFTIAILILNSVLFFGKYIFPKKKVIIEFKSIEFNDIDEQKIANEDLKNIIKYISTHYESPELSLGMIRKALKITENRISLLIKTEFQISYTDYLHQIRITEAKRLFKTSNLNINEVATLVGFGNISTFNRVFKQVENMPAGLYIKSLNN
jgi:YesN/AraC family two-component response regulator